MEGRLPLVQPPSQACPAHWASGTSLPSRCSACPLGPRVAAEPVGQGVGASAISSAGMGWGGPSSPAGVGPWGPPAGSGEQGYGANLHECPLRALPRLRPTPSLSEPQLDAGNFVAVSPAHLSSGAWTSQPGLQRAVRAAGQGVSTLGLRLPPCSAESETQTPWGQP